jgi:hypothetical protein
MRRRKPIYNAVIEAATGELLRAGYCDFEKDGSFDGRAETQVEVDLDDLERKGIARSPRPSGRPRSLDISRDRDGVRSLGSPWTERVGSRMRSPASNGLPRGHVRSPRVRRGSGPVENGAGWKARCRRWTRGRSGPSHAASRAPERCRSTTAGASMAPRVPSSAKPRAPVIPLVPSPDRWGETEDVASTG